MSAGGMRFVIPPFSVLVPGSRAHGERLSTSWPSWRRKAHDLDVKSRVHPHYKTKYHVGNWPAYDRALVQRGDVTLWLAPEAITTWTVAGVGKRGGQLQYSNLAIETALTLRLLFHLPLHQTEGFLTSIFWMLDLDLSAPDHTTLSRRGQHLDPTRRCAPAGASTHLIVDSTGLSIVGEGEWAAAKHGGRGRRGWKKLPLGVDGAGVIIAHALTDANIDDATTGIDLIEAVVDDIARVTADAAYDTIAFYESAGARGAQVVVPPATTATVSRRGPRSSARDRTITTVKEIGRRRWKEGVWRSSAGPRGEHVLPVQVDLRGCPSGSESRRAASRGTRRVQRFESDDQPGKARLVRHREVKGLWVGTVASQFRSMHQRPDQQRPAQAPCGVRSGPERVRRLSVDAGKFSERSAHARRGAPACQSGCPC